MSESQPQRRPQFAYEPEGHGIAVLEQQGLDKWREKPVRLTTVRSAIEEDLEWVELCYHYTETRDKSQLLYCLQY